MLRLSTGSPDLNVWLGGYRPTITCLYGPAGTGKSNLCLLAAVEQARHNKKIIFVDVQNSFSIDRFKQLCNTTGMDYKHLLENILLFPINNFNEQHKKIKGLEQVIKKTKISLIVIDGIGIFYRLMLNRKPELANRMLITQLKILRRIAKTHKIPVLITNQVYADILTKNLNLVGGRITKEWSRWLIELQKDNRKPRKAILRKPAQKEFLFEIRDNGIFKI